MPDLFQMIWFVLGHLGSQWYVLDPEILSNKNGEKWWWN